MIREAQAIVALIEGAQDVFLLRALGVMAAVGVRMEIGKVNIGKQGIHGGTSNLSMHLLYATKMMGRLSLFYGIAYLKFPSCAMAGNDI